MVLALTSLERDRHNSARTRNNRLAAVHSLFRYAALRHPEHCGSIQRVLAIPTKRHDRAEVAYLVPEELDALLAAPDWGTWAGRRDHALLVLVAQAGLRVSELTSLGCQDVSLSTGAHVRVMGKGRKSASTLRLPRTRRAGDSDRSAAAASRNKKATDETKIAMAKAGAASPRAVVHGTSRTRPKKQDVPAKAQRSHLFGSAVGQSSQRTTDFLAAGPEVTCSFDEGRTA